MTYFGFHLRFLIPPIAVLGLLLVHDIRNGRQLPPSLRQRPFWLALLVHVVLAVIYTTPWDNYLVATRVWWYDPARVTGLTLGWVPIEEYTFFVLQTVLTGFWLLWLAPRLANRSERPAGWSAPRWPALIALGLIWLVALAILLGSWQPGTYLALELVWLIVPIVPQVAVGANVLRQQRRMVGLALVTAVAYLSVADALAIHAGVWTINPQQTIGVLLAGVLPLEEFIFFILTNTLIVFGMTLFMGLPNLPARLADILKVTGEKHETEAQ
jgi:lycopene beta-cyclase